MPEITHSTKFPDLYAADRGSPPEFLLERSTRDLGNGPVPKEVFCSAEWAARENDKVWKKVWQMACHANDIPDVGDQIVYDIVDQSVILVRTATDEIKAYHNTCRHRGNRLVDSSQNAPIIKCSFHGWAWDLNGELHDVPCRWDFPSLDNDRGRLAPVRVEVWYGWVFITLSSDTGSLAEFLGPDIMGQLEKWPAESVWKAGHVGKIVPCNWKLALEAFLESYHSVSTHPQILPYSGDADSQYDFYGPHARFIVANGVPSPHLDGVDAQKIVDAMIGDAFADLMGEHEGEMQVPQVGPGQSARDVVSDFMRTSLGRVTGRDYSSVSDVEIMDGIEYFMFPNFVLWGAYGFPLGYRFRPNGRDHESCIFEIFAFAHYPDGTAIPRDAPLRMTPTDESWAEAKEIAGLGLISDQDTMNLMKIQKGLASDSISHVYYSNYQERNLRNFHVHLRQMVEVPD